MMHEIDKKGTGFSRVDDFFGKEGLGRAERVLHRLEFLVERLEQRLLVVIHLGADVLEELDALFDIRRRVTVLEKWNLSPQRGPQSNRASQGFLP